MLTCRGSDDGIGIACNVIPPRITEYFLFVNMYNVNVYLDGIQCSGYQRDSYMIESEAGPSQEPVDRRRRHRKWEDEGGTVPNPKRFADSNY